jgi:hypothetical protein
VARLEAHFPKHVAAVERFRHAGRGEVLRMWRDAVNERGESLTDFERAAPIKRHYELFIERREAASRRREALTQRHLVFDRSAQARLDAHSRVNLLVQRPARARRAEHEWACHFSAPP